MPLDGIPADDRCMECGKCLGTQRCHICGGRARSDASGIATTCPACAGSGRCHVCVPPTSRRTGCGAPTTAEVGITATSPLLHAARKTLTGTKAICGAGPVVVKGGRFDPTAAETCPDCIAC